MYNVCLFSGTNKKKYLPNTPSFRKLFIYLFIFFGKKNIVECPQVSNTLFGTLFCLYGNCFTGTVLVSTHNTGVRRQTRKMFIWIFTLSSAIYS